MNKIAAKSISYSNLLYDLNLKKDILFFDKLLVDKSSYTGSEKIVSKYFEWAKPSELSSSLHDNVRFNISNIDFLVKKGIIEFIDISSNMEISVNQEDRNRAIVEDLILSINAFAQDYNDFNQIKSAELLKKVMAGFTDISDFIVRFHCIKKDIEEKIRILPVLQNEKAMNNETVADKNYITKFIIKQLPTPSDDVSWEQLLEFRSDVDTKAKYYNLIDWINQTSKSNFSLEDFEDKFKYLYNDYLNQYRIHKLKHKTFTLEILVNGIAEILENAVTLKFSKLTSGLFNMFKTKTTLIESEQKISGKELAYIHKANSIVRG